MHTGLKRVKEGEDYSVEVECVVTIKGWIRKPIRFPIDVQRTPAIDEELRGLVQGYYNERMLGDRSPQDWLDIIEALVPEGPYRSAVGCVVWWDHVPEFKIEHYRENFRRAFYTLVDTYCAATDTRALRAELKSKEIDHWDLPQAIMDKRILTPIPDSIEAQVRRLKSTWAEWNSQKAKQADWNRLTSAYVYNGDNIVECNRTTLIRYLNKVGYPHPVYRVGKGEGWKRKMHAKIKTKWGKIAKVLALKPDIGPA